MGSQWASCIARNASRRLRLFTFPYAGGTSAVYRKWIRVLPPAIELWTVDLPGREHRIGERSVPSVSALVPMLVRGLRDYLDEPFAFFGHSLGTLVSFELARSLRRDGSTLPRALVLSGHRAPHVASPRAPISSLPRAAFLAELRRLNGTPAEVLAYEELIDLILPVLRADFAADETYVVTPAAPLDCAIVAYGGTEDLDVPPPHIEAWRKYTAGTFLMRRFAGDHFFVHADEVGLQVGRDLMEIISRD
jgi:medium-chain acyl-[acyl-carrier-protein] hydrolase